MIKIQANNPASTDEDPLFRSIDSDSLTRKLMQLLVSGRTAAIHIRDAVASEDCRRLLKAINALPFDNYDEQRVFPPVAKFGPAISDYGRGADGIPELYWKAVDHCRRLVHEELPRDPFQMCRDLIEAAWHGPVLAAKQGDRSLSGGIVREANHGLQVHYDDVAREHSDTFLNCNIVAQFAFNLYLSAPKVGGELIVWRQKWAPGLEAHQVPGGYGYYRNAIATGVQRVEISPSVGDIVIFDSRNLHTVQPVADDTRRTSLGFFLGLADDGSLVVWS